MTVPDRRPACTASVTTATAASAAITTTSHVHQATAHLRRSGPAALGRS
ncbi:hypothetical protein RFN58_02165 [Streptomyces iakyrus]|nr:hypothetical protein [Streptomyces iakyrus]